MLTPIALPIFQIIDKWEKVIDGITLVYQLKMHSDDDSPTWYLASCWQSGVPSFSAGSRFDVQPDRMQIEIQFNAASAAIVKKAYGEKYTDLFLIYLRKLSTSQESSDKNASPPVVKKGGKYHRHSFEMQILLRKSEQLVKQSNKIRKNSAVISNRLTMLYERSKQFCKSQPANLLIKLSALSIFSRFENRSPNSVYSEFGMGKNLHGQKNKFLTGGLFANHGKPKVLAASKAKSKQIITPEKHIQSSFIAWRNIHKRQFPILNAIFSVPNGFWTENKAYAAAMVQQGLTEGVQDVACLAPSKCGKWHGLLIEFKTEVGKQSDEQIFFHHFFASLNYRTEVCRSAHAASVLVNEHLGIKVPIYPR